MIDWFPASDGANSSSVGDDPTAGESALMVNRLVSAVARRHPALAAHSRRVAVVADALAKRAGWSTAARARLREAALLHDVGMMRVSRDIINRRGRLSLVDWGAVSAHVTAGLTMALDVLDDEQLMWMGEHHERPDGSGYPNGLRDGEISAGGAIIGLADAWSAMTATRAWRAALSASEAMGQCRERAGSQFDYRAVSLLEELWLNEGDTLPGVGAAAVALAR